MHVHCITYLTTESAVNMSLRQWCICVLYMENNSLHILVQMLIWLYNPFSQYVCIGPTDLCSSFFDHFQLTLVDLDAPEETIKEPQENPARQPEQDKKWKGGTETKEKCKT